MVLSRLPRLLVVACLLMMTGRANAGAATSRDAMDRLEEVLELRLEDGRLSADDVMPAILVSAAPNYEASAAWFTTRAIEVLERSFGGDGLRLCEACMAPRTYVEEGALVYQTGPVSLAEVRRLDEQSRGTGAPARSAIWLDEHDGGVAIRIVDLRTARVLFAQNIDPNLIESGNTARMYTLSEELERRARGDSLTQTFVDIALFPGQHVSVDITDQWGADNRNLSGLTISLFDPVVGIGVAHHRCIDALHMLVGGKAIMSVPTAIVRAVGDQGGDVIDPLLTVTGIVRVPFGRSNYGAILSASTNGQIGIGVSLMNIAFLPVLP